MTIQFEKEINLNEKWESIQDKIKDQKINYELWKKIESSLQKHEGKKITKRIETALKKDFPEYTIYLENLYGMYHIVLWGNGIEYQKNIRYLIGYESSNIINMKEILKHNMCYELEKSRSEKLEKMEIEDLEVQVKKWNSGLKDLQEVQKWGGEFELCFDVNYR